jgi:4-oxalocrotonate tautomerase family enzyme
MARLGSAGTCDLNIEETAMPWIEVKLYDHRVNEESIPKIIEAMTQALHESSGAAVEHIQVVVEGVSPKNWGIAGKVQG